MKITFTKEEIDFIAHGVAMLNPSKDGEELQASILKKLYPEPKPKKVLKMKRYSFNFKSGGWNTIMAKTKQGAYLLAVKEYSSLVPDKSTFKLCGSKAYDDLINMSR